MSYNGNYIIVFEGPDGSGKTTQCKLLEEYIELKGKKVYYFKSRVKTKESYKIICEIEEKNNEGGEKKFPKWLKSSLIAYERSKQLYEFFNSVTNSIIIVDKYIYSTEIYLDYINIPPEYPEMLLSWLPKPDLVYYFDLDINVCMDRIISRGGRIGRNENYEFLTILNEKMIKKIRNSVDEICIVDAKKDIDEISLAIRQYIDEYLF